MNSPKNDGWEPSGANNGTYTNKGRNERVTFTTGDTTGTIYVSTVGGSYTGLEKYDSAKHGTPNK